MKLSRMKGIALDLGTSGFRAQAIKEDGGVYSTAISANHPLPGANVMDHLHFCLELGADLTHTLMMAAVNRVLASLSVDLSEIRLVAVCGNPIQLSLFQKMEIRDLAFAGRRAQRKLGIVEPVRRDATIRLAAELGLHVHPDAKIIIPPVVKHEIGADALAMMHVTGMLERDEIALVTDYGTNAEMALKVGDDILTGSAAAGPALEGQHVSSGMLAAPGAIAGVSFRGDAWLAWVLDEQLESTEGDWCSPRDGDCSLLGPMHGKARGITGTGVVAALAEGIRSGLVGPPVIASQDGMLHFQDGIRLLEKDVKEAGKAIGAIRAGHLTLAEAAGIKLSDIDVVYMTGASGTYVDAIQAQEVGLVPNGVARIVQAGNTSLRLAGELVRDPLLLPRLQEIADGIRARHEMFADSSVFKNAYVCELAFWDEGMPEAMMADMLAMYGIQPFPPRGREPEVIRLATKDIVDVGDLSLSVLHGVGVSLWMQAAECLGEDCGVCVDECPEGAREIRAVDGSDFVVVRSELCNGTACRRCEAVCASGAFHYDQLRFDPELPGQAPNRVEGL
ncbi:MAG: methylamine methyltransferase corrinoid protein reductive activase [Thermoleophilia bacterium]|nr:methylamine methyltransferase corrinoid protein reductive activase [Thermoleophilia bacterium]